MASVTSSQAYRNIPAFTIPTTAATPILVPAAGTSSSIPNLPSPTMAVGTAVFLQADPDGQSQNPTAAVPVYVNSSLDGQPFIIRIIGTVTVPAATTFTSSLYLGTSATLANDTLLGTSTSYSITGAGTINFYLSFTFLWDSTSQKLNGQLASLVNGVVGAVAAVTAATVTTPTGFNFLPAFTFGTAGANSVRVTEFSLERL